MLHRLRANCVKLLLYRIRGYISGTDPWRHYHSAVYCYCVATLRLDSRMTWWDLSSGLGMQKKDCYPANTPLSTSVHNVSTAFAEWFITILLSWIHNIGWIQYTCHLFRYRYFHDQDRTVLRPKALSLKQNGNSYTDNMESSYRISTPRYCTQCNYCNCRTIFKFEFIKDTPYIYHHHMGDTAIYSKKLGKLSKFKRDLIVFFPANIVENKFDH